MTHSILAEGSQLAKEQNIDQKIPLLTLDKS